MSVDVVPAPTTPALPDHAVRQLREQNAAITHALRRTNTERAFSQDWETYRAYCLNRGLSPEIPDRDYLLNFAYWMAVEVQAAPETMARRITGVVAAWKRLELTIPPGVSGPARSWLRQFQHQMEAEGITRGRGQADAVTVPQLKRMSRACDDTDRGVRDRALLLIGFAVAARRSELAHLALGDITEHEHGIKVLIRGSKNGTRHPAVLYGSDPALCPVRAWRAWKQRHTTPDDAYASAFVQINRHGHHGRGLSDRSVATCIQERGWQIGADLCGHSLRAGFATESRKNGADIKRIAEQGGWAYDSREMWRYFRVADEWLDNALIGLL